MELNKIKIILDDNGKIIDDYLSTPNINQYATNYLIEVAFEHEPKDPRSYYLIFNINGVDTPAKIMAPVNRYFTLNNGEKSGHIWEYQLTQYETEYYQDELEFSINIKTRDSIITQRVNLAMNKQRYNKTTPVDLASDSSIESLLDTVSSLDVMVRDEIEILQNEVGTELQGLREEIYAELENLSDEVDEQVIQAREWAIGPDSDGELPAANNNSKYFSELSKQISDDMVDVLDSFNLSYQEDTGLIRITYEKDGEIITKEIDLPLEKLVVEVEQYTDEAGNVFLIFKYAGGGETRIQLYDVLKGFVRKTTTTNSVYANDDIGNETNIPMDDESGTLTRRNVNGSINVPLPVSENDAVSLKYMDNYLKVPEGASGSFVLGKSGKNVKAFPAIVGATASTIVLRNVNGDIILPSTIGNNKQFAVSRGYVEPLEKDVSDLKLKVAELESLTLTYVDDSSNKYEKKVPKGASMNAIVSEINGMTHKCKNLVDDVGLFESYGLSKNKAGYYVKPTTTRINSLIFKNEFQNPGVYTVSYYGKVADFTSTSAAWAVAVDYTDGTTGYLCRMYKEDTDYKLMSESTDASKIVKEIYLLYGNSAFTGYIKHLMVYKNEGIPEAYEPYYSGLYQTKLASIESYGNNLCPIPYVGGTVSISYGLTFRQRPDGGINIEGIPTAYAGYKLIGPYALSNFPNKFVVGFADRTTANNIAMDIDIKDSSSTEVLEKATFYPGNNAFRVIDRTKYPDNAVLTVSIKRASNNVRISGVAYPIITEGETLNKYSPFNPLIDTLTIPDDFYLNFPANGVGEYYDSVELDTGKFTRRCEEIILNGTEVWNSYPVNSSGLYRFETTLPAPGYTNVAVSNRFDFVDENNDETDKTSLYLDNDKIFLRTKSHTSAAELKEWLKSNPVHIVYALINPVEEFIEPLDIGKIKVEQNGFIRLNNEKKKSSPTTISYITTRGGINE